MKKLTVGLIVGNRGVFPSYLCETGQEQMVTILESLGFDVVTLSGQDNGKGSIENLEDAQRCARLFAEHREDITGIVISLPNFGDERSIANAIRWSGLQVPVMVHAFPDEVNQMDISRRRDSFCGKISVCNILRQYGIPFSLTRSHTVSPDSPEFKEDLLWFGAVCRVVAGLKNLRVGAIGTRPAAFTTVRYSEKILERAGITVEPVDLSEILGTARSLSDVDQVVQEKLHSIKQYITTTNVSQESLSRMAKLGAAIDQWVAENHLMGTAIQCWTSLEENYGVVPCTLMSMMSDHLLPSACEVDIPGLISMYALQLAAGQPSAIIDWNNNYGEDPNKAVVFHCSNLPKSILDKAHMDCQRIIAKDVGQDNAYGAVCGRIKSGPFTFARITTDDATGQIKGYLGEGTVTADPLDTFGGYGTVEIPGLQTLMGYICTHGFEHHAAITLSTCARVLHEAFTRYLNWDTYYHNF